MSQSKHPAITRDEAFAPFSRDHYTGLVKARQLTRSSEQSATARRDALAQFVESWDSELSEHFDDEERLLLDVMDQTDRQRMLDEHGELRDLARQARQLKEQADPDPAIVDRTGQLLHDHIRWEERDLFNRLQHRLTDEQLEVLHHHTESIEQSRPRSRKPKHHTARDDDVDRTRQKGDDAS